MYARGRAECFGRPTGQLRLGVRPDAQDDPRAAMLEASGFHYNERVECWVHRAESRMIAHATVTAHDSDWLAHWITSGA
jgi:hypothetical protein